MTERGKTLLRTLCKFTEVIALLFVPFLIYFTAQVLYATPMPPMEEPECHDEKPAIQDEADAQPTDPQKTVVPWPANCPVPDWDQTARIISSGFNIRTGRFWRIFDLDFNLSGEYYVEYEIIGGMVEEGLKVRPFPHLFYLDTTDDGFYDKVYRDVNGDGRCEDIRPFEPASRDPKE